MEKMQKLASIYVKIYNKRTLTIDDLTFLAKYDPECFAKTCENLIYKIPETRELMTQELATQEPEEIQMAEEADAQAAQRTEDDRQKIEEEHIRQLLLNLRDMKENAGESGGSRPGEKSSWKPLYGKSCFRIMIRTDILKCRKNPENPYLIKRFEKLVEMNIQLMIQ